MKTLYYDLKEYYYQSNNLWTTNQYNYYNSRILRYLFDKSVTKLRKTM